MTTAADDSIPDLIRTLGEDLQRLLRQEVQHARQELAGNAREAGRGVALLGGAGVFGALAAGTSAALLLRSLERVLPRTTAALVATGLYSGAALVLGQSGIAELRRLSLVPTETLASLGDDLRVASGAAEPPGPATTGPATPGPATADPGTEPPGPVPAPGGPPR